MPPHEYEPDTAAVAGHLLKCLQQRFEAFVRIDIAKMDEEKVIGLHP